MIGETAHASASITPVKESGLIESAQVMVPNDTSHSATMQAKKHRTAKTIRIVLTGSAQRFDNSCSAVSRRAGQFHFGVEVILSRPRGFHLSVLVLPVSRAGLNAFSGSHWWLSETRR